MLAWVHSPGRFRTLSAVFCCWEISIILENGIRTARDEMR